MKNIKINNITKLMCGMVVAGGALISNQADSYADTSADLAVNINYASTIGISLSTNEISFNEVNGTEDAILEKGVLVSVVSNAPYTLNAKLTEDIKSENGDILEANRLSIKESNEGDYTEFEGVNENIELLTNPTPNPDGADRHYFDFKFNTQEKVNESKYRTVINFEAAQN